MPLLPDLTQPPESAKHWQLKGIPALDSPPVARNLAMVLVIMLVVGIVLLVRLPWQQNVHGSGQVIAFSPLERRQTLEAPIKGRIERWYVQEGSKVKKGDLIALITDIDREYLGRLQQQRQTIVNQQTINQSKVMAYELRQQDLEQVLRSTDDSNRAKIDATAAKLEALERELQGAEAGLVTSRLNLERETALQEKGLSAARTLELATLQYQKDLATVNKLKAGIQGARSDIRQAEAELRKQVSDARSKLQSNQATLEEARTSVEKNAAEILKIDTDIARQQSQEIRAPYDGTILMLNILADTVYVKEGDPLATLVPDTQERAVELYMNGNDIPLISAGREVRLQFEGWPALQFSGWPSVAVGTFGGEVALVDASDDGNGKFRIVVRPMPGEQWPENQYLLQGARAKGWVLLDTVPLGFELWRQFNGFPPQLKDQPPKTESEDLIKSKVKL